MSKKDKTSDKTKKRKKQLAKIADALESPVKKKKVKPPVMVAIDLDEPTISLPSEKSGPNLTMILGNISPDGNVEVKMDWNQEFLNQIRSRGFSAGREEEAIMSFLNWMFIVRLSDTPDAAIENAIPNELREALKQHATTGEVIT